MIFGSVDTRNSEGCYLAHSLRTPSGRVGKGTLITATIIEQLIDAGLCEIVVARLEANDVHEDTAAHSIASALCGSGVTVSSARTGRVNLHAEHDGLFLLDATTVQKANTVDPGITVATLPENQWVAKGRMVATVKIIPYAVASTHVERVIATVAAQPSAVAAASVKSAMLIQTRLPAMKESMLDKTRRVTEDRLVPRRAELREEIRCEHNTNDVCEALRQCLDQQPDWILLIGASAISDVADVIPSAVVRCGGTIDRYGIPVDPGNLMMLAHHGSTHIIGLPGCARSPRYNGLDMIIDRLACEVALSDDWLNGLSVGGLLTEIADRPEPRAAETGKRSVSALLLAAGSSQRAGSTNKLLSPCGEHTMVAQVAHALRESRVGRVLAVTGFEHDRVTEALVETGCDCHYNSRYSSGMASSVVAGVSQLIDSDALLVCLGDMPQVKAASLNALIHAYEQHDDKLIFVPTYHGERGNPVLFTRAFFDTLLTLQGDIGARRLVKEYPDQVLEVAVDDPGILQDYDTEEELARLAH